MVSIAGIKTDLLPVDEADAADMVALRNDPANNRFLYQEPLTVENQLAWIRKNKDREDAYNFKVVNKEGQFKGTISVYNIRDGAGEFGRYIVINPIHAIEAEYLLIKLCFENLGFKKVYCQTNMENKNVWNQHLKLGFKTTEIKEVPVGSGMNTIVAANIQEITREEFEAFDYSKILRLINQF